MAQRASTIVDKNGEISKKHDNTLIRTLRKTYGPSFVAGCSDQ
jgi:hypothetical protein